MADQGELADRLLDLAREDLAAAKALEEAEGVSASKSGFNAQQAVEKALKAALAGHGEDFPFTHDIALLIELCEDHGLELPIDLREADRLTPYAAALLYGLGDPAAVDPEDALRWAALAVQWAETQLALTDD
jgi:HEPN domain-containing protein